MSSIPLSELVMALGPGIAEHVAGPADAAVAAVDLFDPDEEGETPARSLQLAIGLDPRSPEALDRALAVVAERDGVLAVRSHRDGAEFLRTAAEAAGAAAVAIDPAMPWTRLFGLVSALLATAVDGERGGGADAGASGGGGDLFALANSVAITTGGAIAIIDTDRTIVAYSSVPGQPIDEPRRAGILARRVPDDNLPDHLIAGLWRSNTVYAVRRPGHLPRSAIVIRAGDRVLGSLWALFPDEAATVGVEPLLIAAARTAALHMLVARRQFDADQDARDQALRKALDRPGAAAAVPCPATLVCLAETAGDSTRTNLMSVLDALGPAARALGYEPALALVGDIVFVHVPHVASAVRMPALLDQLTRRAARVSAVPVHLVDGGVVTSPRQLPERREDLEGTVRHLRAAGAVPGRYALEDLRIDLVAQRLVDAVRADHRLRSGLGARITADDRERGTELGRTLLAVLRHAGDVRAVAEELSLHPNTVRQRLRRATETYGIDLAKPAQRLVLELELRAGW